jgi:transposase
VKKVLDVTQIKEGILALQKTRTGGRIRGKDVQKYLLEKWGIAYKKSAVYDFLKSINLVWISARSKHRAGDHVAQDAFKKTLLQTSKHASHQKQT